MEEEIRPEIQKLVDRGDITLAEWKELHMNSSERDVLVPKLNAEAFHHAVEHVLANCSYPRPPYNATYNDTMLALFVPELLRRLEEAQKPPKREDKHRLVDELGYESHCAVEPESDYKLEIDCDSIPLYEVRDAEMRTICYVADTKVGRLIAALIDETILGEEQTRPQDYPLTEFDASGE